MPSSFATTWTVDCQALLPMGFPGKNTGMGCYFLLQEIFLTQVPSLRLLPRQLNSSLLSDRVQYIYWSPCTVYIVPEKQSSCHTS